jgi:phospholipid-translocating ATPase
MAVVQFGNEDENVENVSKPVKRMRWATQRMPRSGGTRKRVSIMERFQRQHGVKEEKRKSAGTTNTAGSESVIGNPEEDEDDEEDNRTILFNLPLPDEAKDEEGYPKASYPRNKIRTAKYTPLSFIPKNLWFQFHNIANIYFLFIIILSVRLSWPVHRTG